MLSLSLTTPSMQRRLAEWGVTGEAAELLRSPKSASAAGERVPQPPSHNFHNLIYGEGLADSLRLPAPDRRIDSRSGSGNLALQGYRYLCHGAYQLAREIFGGLTLLDGGCAYYPLALGVALDHLGDREGARAAYSQAAARAPQDPRPLVNRAELHRAAGEEGAAREDLLRAQQLVDADRPLAAKIAALLGR